MGTSFSHIIGALNKLAHLLQSPLTGTDPTYATWLSSDYYVMTWLLNSLGEKISGSVMFFTTAKEMCDTLNMMYGNEKNPSRVFGIYERLFVWTQPEINLYRVWRTQGSDWWVRDASVYCHWCSDTEGYRQDLACQSSCLAWVYLFDPRCRVRYWEKIIFLLWLLLFSELYAFLL